jgi:hypothetical protein
MPFLLSILKNSIYDFADLKALQVGISTQRGGVAKYYYLNSPFYKNKNRT